MAAGKRQRSAVPGGAADKHEFIAEDYVSYLGGGPFNRFALALKSNLDNEVDWGCARLAAATHEAPDWWSLQQHSPFLIEAIVGVLERCRRELGAKRARRRGEAAKAVKEMVLGDSGSGMVTERAHERAALMATVLFNIAQVGDNATVIAQDPRVAIEITQWLHTFHTDDAGLCAIKTELLDVLDVLVPLTPAPRLDTQLERWPEFGSRDAAVTDPLALVESCLWAELLRILCTSRERKVVIGAMRVMVQSIAWHPQLAREILDLAVPTWALMHQGGDVGQYAGELVSSRLAELVLSPDAEVVAASFELLLNTIRLEAMARTLDEELDAHALKMQANGKAASVSGGGGGCVRRPRRARGDGPATPSGGESGSQTPLFGFRPPSRTVNLSVAAAAFCSEAVASAPSMLPDGLVSLVALVLQQWMSAACPPPQVLPPLTAASLASTRSAMAASARGGTGVPQPQQQPQQQPQSQPQQQAANRPPTEPELREACTWVLLNYELNDPDDQQIIRHSSVYVVLTELYARYMIAKQGQVVPRIGRPLSMNEMMRVVSAVFPKAPLQTVNVTNSSTLPGQPAQQQTRTTVAYNLRQKTMHIVPIPAVAVEGAPPRPPQQQSQSPATAAATTPAAAADTKPAAKTRVRNACNWAECSVAFESEEQALAHLAEHAADADACRWHNCNRIPAGPPVDGAQMRQWVARHVLIHGPFVAPADASKDGQSADPEGPQQAAAAAAACDAESQLLSAISPALGGGRSPESDQQRQHQILQLVMQGVGVVEQLQRWADRRSGPRGEQDRIRVWRCGSDVLERMAFVAAQPTSIAGYAARLLAIISKANVA
ncbi:hypothetical protein IWQ57_002827 [Coemansia nantahalensis]|uniref:Uncharacterized protein n=1 Tax=Coemansia nantahalensis TaxID=2789366 RepID=A0ACC1JYK9_9FUNG|nr:hypothetical protein IWQ57_002827 [Coemansia nantahalensis]